MADQIIPTRWGDPFVDASGVPSRVSQGWIDSITRIANSSTSSLESRLDVLEPQYRVVTSADSPVTAANNDYILADMSTGDISITLPASGRLYVTRSGSSNTLTLTGTVNGVTDPTIVADGDAPALAYIGTEWRYV